MLIVPNLRRVPSKANCILVNKVFGVIATWVLYAGGERTAKKLPLLVLTVSYIINLGADIVIIAVRYTVYYMSY